jgi:hypothetical protein
VGSVTSVDRWMSFSLLVSMLLDIQFLLYCYFQEYISVSNGWSDTFMS